MSTPTPPPLPPSNVPESSTPNSQKGFFGRLFDLSFSEFVTPSLIKVIYIVGIVLGGLLALITFASLASRGGGSVVAGIVIAPLIFFIYVLFARVLSEVYLILFRIEENTRKD